MCWYLVVSALRRDHEDLTLNYAYLLDELFSILHLNAIS